MVCVCWVREDGGGGGGGGSSIAAEMQHCKIWGGEAVEGRPPESRDDMSGERRLTLLSSHWLQCLLLGKWSVAGASGYASLHTEGRKMTAQYPNSSPCAACIEPMFSYWSPIRPRWGHQECKYPPAPPPPTLRAPWSIPFVDMCRNMCRKKNMTNLFDWNYRMLWHDGVFSKWGKHEKTSHWRKVDVGWSSKMWKSVPKNSFLPKSEYVKSEQGIKQVQTTKNVTNDFGQKLMSSCHLMQWGRL